MDPTRPGTSKWNDLKGVFVMVCALAVIVTGFYSIVKYVGFDAKVLRI